MVYRWNSSSHIKANAQVVGQELENISAESKGRLTPADVVEKATPEDAPLHGLFEWNNRVAADAYRQDQARYIIRMINIVDEDEGETPPIRAFVSVKQQEGNAYEPISIVMADSNKREQFLEKALNDLLTWQKRYEQYSEFSKIFSAIKKTKNYLSEKGKTNGKDKKESNRNRSRITDARNQGNGNHTYR